MISCETKLYHEGSWNLMSAGVRIHSRMRAWIMLRTVCGTFFGGQRDNNHNTAGTGGESNANPCLTCNLLEEWRLPLMTYT